MHLAPAAQWRLERGRAHAGLLIVAAAFHFLVLFFLWGQVAASAWWGLLALALALLLHAGWRWWKSPVGVLRWTGQEWQLLSAHLAPLAWSAQVCTLRWVLDFQTVALVQVGVASGKGTSRWFWLERGAQNLAPWTALRRALVASALNAEREVEGGRAGAESGATISFAGYLTGSQVPHLRPRGAPVSTSAGANGFRDSSLR